MEKRWFEFSGQVRVSDVISALAILLSGFGIIHSLGEKNALTEREMRQQERAAAVRAVARLDRWQAVQSAMEVELQPIVIRVTETLRETRDRERARDQFWREIIGAYAVQERRIVSEQLDTGYEEVLVYLPRSRRMYLDTYRRLQEAATAARWQLLNEGQQAILSTPPDRFANTADLGNRLRTVLGARFEALRQEADQVTREPRELFCRQIAPSPEEVEICASSADRVSTRGGAAKRGGS